MVKETNNVCIHDRENDGEETSTIMQGLAV